MKLFYRASSKELLDIRNKIFLDNGIPALVKNGFQQSPFSTAWSGRDNLKNFSYEFCRLATSSQLEMITVHVLRGDRWIQVYVNVFDLKPDVVSLSELKGVDGLQYHLPPNSKSQMRLRSDDYKGIPLFYMLFGKEHKVGRHLSKSGFNSRVKQLSELVAYDMTHIDAFIKRWHQMYQPMRTTWQGHQLDEISTISK